MSLESKLVAIEALIASIRLNDSEKPKGLDPKAVMYADPKAVMHKPTKTERFTSDEFMDFLHKNSYDKKFMDGFTRRTVKPTIARNKWPLDMDGNEYPKLQDLCADFRLDCMRDDPKMTTMFIVLDVAKADQADEADKD